MHLRQAIITRYHGPTNTRGSRISATAQAGRIYLAHDYSLGIEENHAKAAEAYARKSQWSGEWIGGAAPDFYCWTLSATDRGLLDSGFSV